LTDYISGYVGDINKLEKAYLKSETVIFYEIKILDYYPNSIFTHSNKNLTFMHSIFDGVTFFCFWKIPLFGLAHILAVFEYFMTECTNI